MDSNTGHEKANEQKWSRRSRTYDEKRFDYFRYMQKRLISPLDLKKGSNFLDIGCGTGWAVRYAAEILDGEGDFTGIDISGGMIEKAIENSRGLKNVHFYKASAESLPLESYYFDNIICTNSFHHYLNPVKVLIEVKRVLKQGGKIYILDVTSDDFITARINKIVQKKEQEHVKFYSTKEYKNMFKEAGLTHIKSGSIMYPLKVHIAEKQHRGESNDNISRLPALFFSL